MPAKKRRQTLEDLQLASLSAGATRVEIQAEVTARVAVPQYEPATNDVINVAAYLRHAASRTPDARALIASRGKSAWSLTTYAELDAETDRIAAGLLGLGLKPAERIALLLPNGRDLIALTFAAWKAGLVPVHVDSALSLDLAKSCLAEARPAALVGSAKVLAARMIAGRAAASVRVTISVGTWLPSGLPFAGHSLDSLRQATSRITDLAPTRALDEALVRFTSPAHGVPRLVSLDHRAIIAETESLRHLFGFVEGEVALSTATWSSALGVLLGLQVVLPDLDMPAAKEAEIGHVIEALDAHVVTLAFGAPETWRRVAEDCGRRSRSLPQVRRVVLGGGPVPPQLHEWLKSVMPQAETVALYALAEARPLASLTGSEMLGETRSLTERGGGLCLGRPVRGVDVSIVKVIDGPIEKWTAGLVLATGDVGEILVRSSVLAPKHASFAGADPARDVDSGERAPFHRTGDLGWLDRQGRLWHVGRIEDVIQTRFGALHPLSVEGIFAAHPFARRVAVVGMGAKAARDAVLVVEGPNAKGPKDDPERVRVQAEFLRLAETSELARRVSRVLFHPGVLPADDVSASKIDRISLGEWAQVQLGGLGITR